MTEKPEIGMRWRDFIADLYVRADSDRADHVAAFRALLFFTPASAQQIPFVLGAAASGLP